MQNSVKPIQVILMQGEGDQPTWIATDKKFHMAVTDKDPNKAISILEKKLQGRMGVDNIPIDAEATHRDLAALNTKHKFTPFSVIGSNYYDLEEDGYVFHGWDWGWTSRGFGFDGGHKLENAIKEVIEYATIKEPKVEDFFFDMRLRRFAEKNQLEPALDGLDRETKEELKKFFWQAYNLGAAHKDEQFKSLNDPHNYNWSQWKLEGDDEQTEEYEDDEF